MSDPLPVPQLSPRHYQWLRLAGRIGGVTAVVLGGWSLWLAFSTGHKPDHMEALDELHEEIGVEADDELPEPLRLKPRRPRPAVQITDLTINSDNDDSADVEPAGYLEQQESTASEVATANFSSESLETALDSTEQTASAAWLTGEIQDSAAAAGEPAATFAADPPAASGPQPWKRTTKSPGAASRTRSATHR